MKQPVYLIPGFGESCKSFRYKRLLEQIRAKGYRVKPVSPDWRKPISSQTFAVEHNAIIIGFSIGAVLAYLIAKKTPCQKVILASLSPVHTFDIEKIIPELAYSMSLDQARAIVTDWTTTDVSLSSLTMPHVTLAGALETDLFPVDIIVPQAKHFVGSTYRAAIVKLL